MDVVIPSLVTIIPAINDVSVPLSPVVYQQCTLNHVIRYQKDRVVVAGIGHYSHTINCQNPIGPKTLTILGLSMHQLDFAVINYHGYILVGQIDALILFALYPLNVYIWGVGVLIQFSLNLCAYLSRRVYTVDDIIISHDCW